MNQCKKVYALTVVFVVDFFQVGLGRVNALKPDFRGGVSCPDHRGGVGSGIDRNCSGRGRVTHDPVPIRPVAIPIQLSSKAVPICCLSVVSPFTLTFRQKYTFGPYI
jgi:hypothetical protein